MPTGPVPDEPTAEPGGSLAHVNQVRLRGRVSAPAEQRVLPSGDLLVTARLVVRRTRPSGRDRQPIDTLDCMAWSGRVRRSMLSWQPGSLVEVEGAIRRRFSRRAGGLTSRVEIEVLRARRVRAPSADSPGSR